MKKYELHWLHGDTEIVEGENPASAMNNVGIAVGALQALDYYEEVSKETKEEVKK